MGAGPGIEATHAYYKEASTTCAVTPPGRAVPPVPLLRAPQLIQRLFCPPRLCLALACAGRGRGRSLLRPCQLVVQGGHLRRQLRRTACLAALALPTGLPLSLQSRGTLLCPSQLAAQHLCLRLCCRRPRPRLRHFFPHLRQLRLQRRQPAVQLFLPTPAGLLRAA